MLSPKIEKYIDEIVHYVRYPYDRISIRKELEDHMMDRMEDYIQQGVEPENAENRVIEAMGNAKEIGRELNRQHNPILGWALKLTNMMVILLGILVLYLVGSSIIITLDNSNLVKEIKKSDIVYRIDLKKTVKIDDMVINFTNYIYDKEDNMHIFYEYYDTKLWGSGWSSCENITVSDNNGTTYHNRSSYGSGGIIRHCHTEIENFSRKADTLTISYEGYNRSYKVEIPLKAGDKDE